MTQIEVVALWAGLLTGVVSIALALVAIRFSEAVDERSRKINEQMLQSLQKIETTVDRQSSDTVNLIQMAWERLLGQVHRPGTGDNNRLDESSRQAIVDGVVTELRARFRSEDAASYEGNEASEDLEEWITSLQSSLSLLERGASGTGASEFDEVVETFEDVSHAARELARQLVRGRHLTAEEFAKLRHPSHGLVSEVAAELRKAGAIVPLRGHGSDGGEILVYWFPPGWKRYVPSALLMLDHEPDKGVQEAVSTALSEVGWEPGTAADS